MGLVASVYRKEMRAYLVSPIPYILISIVALGLGYVFFYGVEGVLPVFWDYGAASLSNLFRSIPLTFAIIVPGLTMRMWSEELRAGTIETLGTLPVSSRALVLGKFLAALSLLAACLVATLPVAFTVAGMGRLDWGPVLGGYLGALFLGGALVAIGLWLSALTRHQIVAFFVTLVVGFVLCFVLSTIAGRVQGAAGDALNLVALDTRYDSLGRGVLELRDLVYFATLTAFFLYVNAEVVANRRYR
jgi:ABC-2 type transport system permease protein